MSVKMQINQDWTEIYKQVVENGKYVEFPSKWNKTYYEMFQKGENFYFKLVINYKDIYINEEWLYSHFNEDQQTSYVFENFFGDCKNIVNLIENLRSN